MSDASTPNADFVDHEVHGPHVWYRNTFRTSQEFFVSLPTDVLDEIERSIAALRLSGTQWDRVTRDQIPLRSFTAIGRDVRRQTLGEGGRGFVVIRGIDASRYSIDELKIIFWAVGAHLGSLIPQNLKGDRMVTVADRGYGPADTHIRSSMTNRQISFHTDTVILGEIEIVALLCVVQAISGGASRLASAAAIYNLIARESPELLEPLSHDFPIDRREEYTSDMGPTANAPLLARTGDLVRTQCHYNLMVTGAKKINRIFTEQEQAAIEKMNDVLSRDEIAVECLLQPGEMLFASNSLVLHDRARWVDSEETAKRRHFERMWLSAKNS